MSRTLEIAKTIMSGFRHHAPCTCGNTDNHTKNCAYTRDINDKWDYSVDQAREIVLDSELSSDVA